MTSAPKGRLIIVCGLPGSGKTTLATSLEAKHRAIRLSPDEWMAALRIDLYDEEARARVEALQWDLARRLLALGQVVIVEWGTWAKSERDALRTGARTLGAAVEMHYVSAAPSVLVERVRARAKENPPISEDAIHRWIERFDVPDEDELALYDRPA